MFCDELYNDEANILVMCRFSLEHGVAFVIGWILEFIILKPFLLTALRRWLAGI